MTLSSRHRIPNSSPGGLRPTALPLGHGGSPQYWLSHVDGEETFFVSFKPPRPGTEPRTLAWKVAVLTTTLGPPPSGRTAVKYGTWSLFRSNSLHSINLINARSSVIGKLLLLQICYWSALYDVWNVRFTSYQDKQRHDRYILSSAGCISTTVRTNTTEVYRMNI